MQSYNVLVLGLKPAQPTGSGNETSLPLLPAEALGSLGGSLALVVSIMCGSFAMLLQDRLTSS